MLLRNKQFDEAKAKFQLVEATVPNYKSVRRYLARIDEDRQAAEREAVLERTRNEEKRFQEMEAQRAAE